MYEKDFEIIDFDFKKEFTPIKWVVGFGYGGRDFAIFGKYEGNKLVSEVCGTITADEFQDIYEEALRPYDEQPPVVAELYEFLGAIRETKIVNYMLSPNAIRVSLSEWRYSQMSEAQFAKSIINPVIASSLLEFI